MRHAQEIEFLESGQATDAKEGEKEAQETEVDNAESLFALHSPSFRFYGFEKWFISSGPKLEQGAEAASPDEEV